MSLITWLILFFVILLVISITVYALVIKFFYWGDKKEAPTKKS